MQPRCLEESGMPSNLIIIDASIAVKWFHEEVDSKQAEALQERIVKGEVRAMVPPLFFYEVANALMFKARSEAEQVSLAHQVLRSMPLQVVEVIYTIFPDAIHIARKYKLSVYDSVYVALAVSTGVPLITADQNLFRVIGAPIAALLS